MNPMAMIEEEKGAIRQMERGGSSEDDATVEKSLAKIPNFLRSIKNEATEIFLEVKSRLPLIIIKFGSAFPYLKEFSTNFNKFFSNERIKYHKKLKKKTLKKVSGFRWRTYLKVLPGVNVIYDMFFSETTPTQRAIIGLLDIVGLLNGLLLSSAIALVVAASFQECIDADIRFISRNSNEVETGYQLFWRNHYGSDYPSQLLFQEVHGSVCCVFAAITGVVYMYSDLVAKISNEGALNDIEKKEEEWYFELWWKYARFGAILLLCLTVASCTYIVFAVNILCLIKYPDYHVAIHGKADSDHSPIYQMYQRYKTIFTTSGLIIATCCGVGTARVHLEKLRIHAAFIYRTYFAYSDTKREPYCIENRCNHNDPEKIIGQESMINLETLMNLRICRTVYDENKVPSDKYDNTYLTLLKKPTAHTDFP